MPIDINTDAAGGSGDFLPVVKWDAQVGECLVRRSVKNAAGGWDKNWEQLNFPLRFVADFENLERGWIRIKGTPDFVMTKLSQPKPAQPSAEHAEGVRFNIFGKATGLAAFSHTAKTVMIEIKALFLAYEAGKAANAGKLPVVEIKGIKKVERATKDGAKTYRVPDWSIVSWADRPAEFSAAVVAPEPVKQVELDDSVDF